MYSNCTYDILKVVPFQKTGHKCFPEVVPYCNVCDKLILLSVNHKYIVINL